MIQVLNVYGPYSGRRAFWDRLEATGLINDPSLILAGDLNFTLCPNEVWGSGRVADLLAGYFIDLFENSHLVDVVPHSLYPTWSNGRCGADYVGKLLDHFLMAEELCNLFGKYRSWSYAVGIFDHKAILLQLDFGIKPTSHPFKFNAGILKDPDFDSWFRETWEKLNLSHGAPSLAGFIHKIQWIKPLIQSWVKLKKSKDLLELEVIEEKIVQFHYRSDLYPLSIEQCSSLADLLAAKDRILLSIEEEWRQKSRATWLMAGDRNTKFFQRYANQRRLQNAIWEVSDAYNRLVVDESSIKMVAQDHFRGVYTKNGEHDLLH